MVEIRYSELNKNMQNNVGGYIASYSNTIMPKPEYEMADVKPLIANNNLLNYYSFDGVGINLDDNNKSFYTAGDYAGYISDNVSDENCFVNSSGFIHLEYPDGYLDFEQGLTIAFYGDCCAEIDIQYVKPDTTSHFETLVVTDDLFHFVPDPYYAENAYSINIYFTKTKLPHQFIKISYIKFSKITVLDKLKDVGVLEEISVLSDDLPVNSLNFSAIMQNEFEFKDNAQLDVYSNNKYYGSFFVNDVVRTSKDIYEIQALNCIQKLNNAQYKECFFGNEISIFLNEIYKKTDVEFDCGDKKYTIFGNIKIDSCRYALCQYAFACRLIVDSSRNDGVLLKQIPNSITSVILTKDKRILGDAIYTKIKPITLSKYQYASSFEYEEDIIELKVIPNERTLVYFEEPVEILDEQQEGLTIFSKAFNYIDFVSNVENILLNVYKLNFTYNNIDILNNTTSNIANNEKDYAKLNLRGAYVDENNVVNQLIDSKIEDIKKYMLSGGTVKAKIILSNERVGDLIQIETAFDGIKTGIITSMNVSFGFKDVAEIEVLEWPIG